MKKYLIIISVLFTYLSADTIHFKNGDVLTNCKILWQNDTQVSVQYVYLGKEISNKFNFSIIDNIETNEYNPHKESDQNIKISSLENISTSSNSSSKINMNYKMLPLSFVSILLGIDYSDNAKDIKKTIKAYKDQNIDTNDLEEKRDKYMTRSILFFSVGLINTLFAFENIDIENDQDGVKISYSLP